MDSDDDIVEVQPKYATSSLSSAANIKPQTTFQIISASGATSRNLISVSNAQGNNIISSIVVPSRNMPPNVSVASPNLSIASSSGAVTSSNSSVMQSGISLSNNVSSLTPVSGAGFPLKLKPIPIPMTLSNPVPVIGLPGSSQDLVTGNPGAPGTSGYKQVASTNQYQGMFGKEIRSLMYGLGDSKTPYIESVELVEQLVIKFVVDLLNKSQDVSSRPGNRVAIEDIVFVLRKDRAKFARVRELLTVNDELKKAKKAISDLDSVPAT